jgi:catechol 2,3-dioxygenase-like lactoylglutathione lyase family enzyme
VGGIARLSVVALDCRDPLSLAEFYRGITGWDVEGSDHDEWVELRSGGGATLAFQLAPDHQPPEWPSAERPQQIHLDFDVEDLDVAEEQVLELGARKADVQPGTSFRVFLDPAGHPFCLVRPS